MIQHKEAASTFQHIIKKLKMQKGTATKEDILYAYIAEVKNDLIRNLGKEDTKSDTTMASSKAKDITGDDNHLDLNDEDFVEIFDKLEKEAHNVGKKQS